MSPKMYWQPVERSQNGGNVVLFPCAMLKALLRQVHLNGLNAKYMFLCVTSDGVTITFDTIFSYVLT